MKQDARCHQCHYVSPEHLGFILRSWHHLIRANLKFIWLWRTVQEELQPSVCLYFPSLTIVSPWPGMNPPTGLNKLFSCKETPSEQEITRSHKGGRKTTSTNSRKVEIGWNDLMCTRGRNSSGFLGFWRSTRGTKGQKFAVGGASALLTGSGAASRSWGWGGGGRWARRVPQLLLVAEIQLPFSSNVLKESGWNLNVTLVLGWNIYWISA